MAAEAGFNEYARYVSTPVSMPGALDEWGGSLHFFRFSATQGVDMAMTSGDNSPMLQLRKGWRILGGNLKYEAGGAGATFQIGITGTVGKYSGAIDVSAAGTSDFANTIALNYGELLTADEIIIGSWAGANFASGKKIAGHMLIGMGS
jgi:hypothetical protein